ncbi:hypothetical protein ACN38_g9992 [Penicillium nordicum]|uniref:Uncharacterized protein n=1 Tax=Penicillium nordicum TaxID=229535 RepID=A0A0M8P2A6_9EURO|nr:hypothetical protein ACN38_g9992 [Penicillium nordicum]
MPVLDRKREYRARVIEAFPRTRNTFVFELKSRISLPVGLLDMLWSDTPYVGESRSKWISKTMECAFCPNHPICNTHENHRQPRATK